MATPVPPGLSGSVGPVSLPHQSKAASSPPVAWLSCTPVVTTAKLSSVAVRVLVSLDPEPTTMPVVSSLIVLSVIVPVPPFSIEMPVVNQATAIPVAVSEPPSTSIPVMEFVMDSTVSPEMATDAPLAISSSSPEVTPDGGSRTVVELPAPMRLTSSAIVTCSV